MTNDGPGIVSRSTFPRSSRIRPVSLIATLLSLVALVVVTSSSARASPFKSKFPFAAGDQVQVEGTVTDTLGRALPDLEVVLEMSKLQLSLRPFGREKRNISRGATSTDSEGHFAFEWEWTPGFDRFEVITAVYIAEPEGKRLQVLERVDITAHVRQGHPISVPVLLEDTELLEQLAELREHLDSADEQRVYKAHGRPDRIDSNDYDEGSESAWWYFKLGKVYRFVEGRLTATETFDPVAPI